LSGEERKHLVAHSVTAMLVVRSTELYSRAEIAVLEHHERMDGSGYPRGIKGTISPMGQVLLLAEVVSAFFENSRTCRVSACRSCCA
jgi:HD-GYP domain-containing protein (c-di-GMP phosphodiesterase class II)